ncbi:hydroxymethylbilane synthase [uncultured Devosia sp.]|uniref:hydroxymethylbilane synthase n=1 Tax=uncultured Devosia sp. TaxID=211434 RepID=UPI0035CAA30D
MQSPTPFARIGTRGSPLALVQARLVQEKLAQAHGIDPASIEIKVISTGGDRSQQSNASLTEIGGKGLFTKEIDQALLSGAIDLGVHSCKDVASVLPKGIALPAFLEREDVRDAFISVIAGDLDELPRGARFGTSSIRRTAQVLRRRPDLVIVPFRGNVDTRLQKLVDGVAEATMLAVAGLNRLGQGHRATAYLDPSQFMPAPAQGAVGIAIRQEDQRLAALVAPLDHRETHLGIVAERALLRVLDGSCRTPVGALSRLEGDMVLLRGEIISLDGQTTVADSVTGPAGDAEALGAALGQRLLDGAGSEVLARWAQS